ncbi:hypothetical protein O0L34_g3289 [Tuta absoluta]|nr:hypothetical protein O0L34_g3289 [Tuta absoluta]
MRNAPCTLHIARPPPAVHRVHDPIAIERETKSARLAPAKTVNTALIYEQARVIHARCGPASSPAAGSRASRSRSALRRCKIAIAALPVSPCPRNSRCDRFEMAQRGAEAMTPRARECPRERELDVSQSRGPK